MPETHDSPRLLTARQAADIAKVDVSTLRTWIRQENLRAVQRKPQILVDREDLDQFLRQRMPPAPALPPEHEPLMDDEGGTPRQLTARKAAAIAKVHPKTILKWVSRGNLRAVQRKPQTLIDREVLDQFLRDRKPPAQAASTEHQAATEPAFREDKPGELADGMAETHDSPQLLTTKEAAAIAGVKEGGVRWWVARGRLRAVQRRPKMLIDPEDLEQFLHIRKSPVQTVSPGHEPLIDEAVEAARLLTTREAAAIARVDMSTVNKWVRRGILHAVQREPYLLINREDLERFLQQRKPPTQATSPEPEAATGTAPYDDQPGDLAQGRSAEADEERQGAEGGQDPARLLTRKEAAAIAGIHRSTIGRWARTKKIQTTTDGLIPSSELQRLGYLGSDDTHREEQLELIAVAPRPAPAVSSRPSDSIALLLQERDALRRERDYLLHALDDARDREHRQTALLQGELNAARDRELRLLRMLEAERLPAPTGRRRNPREDSLPPPTPTPSPHSLSAQVLEYLEAQQRPRYAREVQQALGLSTSPARTLRHLVNRGKARRLKPGLYAALSVPGYIPPGRVQEPAPDTRLGQVLAYVRTATQAGRSVLGWQIQEALGLPERPHRELSKLHVQGFILRVRDGVYMARRPEDETQGTSDHGES